MKSETTSQQEISLLVKGLAGKTNHQVWYPEGKMKGKTLFATLSTSLYGTSKKRASMAKKVGQSLREVLGLPDSIDLASEIATLAEQSILLPLILNTAASLFKTGIVVLE